MPTRNLGKTGYKVGIYSLGGQAAVEQPNNAAIAVPIVERALDLGVNYIDTAGSYGGIDEQWSEKLMPSPRPWSRCCFNGLVDKKTQRPETGVACIPHSF